MSKQTVAAEHRRLNALFSEARAALVPHDAPAARRALGDLAAALAQHFEREDSLYYPPVASLRPGDAERVRAFAAAHARFLGQLEEVARRVGEKAPAEASRAFEAFALSFAAHEAAEEELLLEVESEAAAR